MSNNKRLWLIAMACLAAAPSAAFAQARPYVGYVYPAGGQRGTTFAIRLGGQNMDDVNLVVVSGTGVQGKVYDHFKRLSNTDFSLMREQLAELQQAQKAAATRKTTSASTAASGPESKEAAFEAAQALRVKSRIEQRLAEYVQNPACQSISSLAFVEITIAPDAAPGQREIRVATPRGVSNPLVFHVGQLPETARKPMLSAMLQVLGKEEGSLRQRPSEEAEVKVTLPCTANGQIASGEINSYRFDARKGQRLVFSVDARSLTPYIADAVPGWFQPVLSLCDSGGREVAYCDDYRFKPDPVIFFEVPRDDTYVLRVSDAIYRGREDFVYRVTMGELPFVKSIFPLGGKVDDSPKIEMVGWNLDKAVLTPPSRDFPAAVERVAATKGQFVSNRMPFVHDTLPQVLEKEPNNSLSDAQKVTLPAVVNGRIDRPGDWDVFQFEGQAGQTVVAEVTARRLESPLDSVIKLTDQAGKVLAMNDDYADPEAGVNTHDADSYLMFKLPVDGTYFVHVGDTARQGGPEYTYRLRLSQPMPDFSLLVVPTSVTLSSKGSGNLNVQAIRKDGYAGPITVRLKDPAPDGFSAPPVSIPKDKTTTRLSIKTTLTATTRPVDVTIEGQAKIDQRDVSHDAVAAEDRMQAFLWRHLVPASDLQVVVYDQSAPIPPKRVRERPQASKPASATAASAPATSIPAASKPASSSSTTAAASPPAKPTFTKQQVAGLLRQLKYLYEEELLTDDFYDRKVAECEAAR